MKNEDEQLKVLKRISNNLAFFFWTTITSFALTMFAILATA